MQLKQNQAQMQQMQQQMQQMQMVIKQRQDIEQVKQDAETKRVLIKETNRAHEMELTNAERLQEMQMKMEASAHEVVIKTETQKEIERMKAEVALMLANLDKASAHAASLETTERAI
jgi:hypothetical protein